MSDILESATKLALETETALEKRLEATTAFKLNTGYWPDNTPPVFSLNDQSLIWPGEFFSLAAKPGAGKSNTCEAIISAWVLSYYDKQGYKIDADTLGFNACVQQTTEGTLRRGLWYDFERTKRDAWQSWSRIYKRLGLHLARPDEDKPQGLPYDKQGNINAMDFYSCRHIKGVEERLVEISRLMELEYEKTGSHYGFIMLDGGLKMVNDFNNIQECSMLVDTLCEIAEKYDTSIGITLHVNPGSDKITGHLGSIVNRYCRASLLIKNHETEKQVRIITTDFGMGKSSFSDGGDVAFKWDEEMGYMVTCETPEITKPAKFTPDHFIQAFKKLAALGKTGWIASNVVKQAYMDVSHVGEEAAKKAIRKASTSPYNYLEKSGSTKDTVIRIVVSEAKNETKKTEILDYDNVPF
jgi:hypothetical protein